MRDLLPGESFDPAPGAQRLRAQPRAPKANYTVSLAPVLWKTADSSATPPEARTHVHARAHVHMKQRLLYLCIAVSFLVGAKGPQLGPAADPGAGRPGREERKNISELKSPGPSSPGGREPGELPDPGPSLHA